MTPRVAVNMLWCVPGRVGGSEQYLVRQLSGLCEASAGEFDVQVFAPRGFVDAHARLATSVVVHESQSSAHVRPLRVLREATWFVSGARGAALVHHGGGTVPPRSPQPALLTIHDLQYLAYPQYFSSAKLRYLSARVPASAHRARHIVVPSEYVRQTVIDRLAVASDDVSVVRHGVEASLGGHRTSEADLRSRFGLTAARVLAYPAITHPHKNHQFLCELLAGPLRNADVQVVCAGGEGRAHDALRRRIADEGLHERVKLVGRLNDAERDGLLAMSTALVFPSSYEGFGAPVIEAMALGTPVIASDRTALPEVVADAGQVVTLDVEAWAAAIESAVRGRDEWVRRGVARASQFRSVDSGRDLAAAYRCTMEKT
ncbi:MAG: glycosyltransferase family 4 protein [Actinomycetota bacterium]